MSSHCLYYLDERLSGAGTRYERLDILLRYYGPSPVCYEGFDVDDPERYLLLATRDRERWFTIDEDLEFLGRYGADEQNGEGWEIQAFYDLDTGKRIEYGVKIQVEFKEQVR